MNAIKNIEIKNFKSIRHLKIEDCRRINVFVGYPNVGKSNILEALGLFSIDKPGADFTSFVRAEELTTLFFDGNIGEKIEVRINENNRIIAELFDSNKINFAWQLSSKGFSFDQKESVGQPYGILNFIKIEGEDKVNKWDSIFKRQVRSDDFINKLKEDGQLAPVKKYSFQKNIAFTSGKYDSLAVPNGENIFDIIYTHSDIRRDVASLFEVYDLKLLYNSTDKKFSILKSLDKGTIFTIPYKLIADTLQRLIFYSVAIANNKDSILIFEEPEAHMFPPYVRKFSSDVIFDKTNQFFIATHSPYVLDTFMEEVPEDLSIYLVYYENGETKVKLMSEKDMEEVNEYGVDLFYNLESYLKHGQVNNA